MKMSGSRSLPASRAAVWQALNDTEVLRSCIAGCERLEPTEDSRYTITLTAVVGPVKARFNGRMSLLDLDPPSSYRLEFDAQGAAAGFGKGRAAVTLREEGPRSTTLDYAVEAQIGGKLAQVGSRLVDAAAKKFAADFFDRFESSIAASIAVGQASTGPVPDPQPARLPWAAWALAAAAAAGALWWWSSV